MKDVERWTTENSQNGSSWTTLINWLKGTKELQHLLMGNQVTVVKIIND